MASIPTPPPHPAPHPPTALTLPSGAWDTHCHLFGPFDRFPLPAGRSYTPAEASLNTYVRMQERLGLSRAVFVQSAVYGPDHSIVVDALKRGRGRYAGTALPGATTTDDEIQQLDEAGLRATPFHFLPQLGP